MKSEFKDKLLEELVEIEANARKYLKGELSLKEFKHMSGGFGFYGQNGGQNFMLRLRLTGGEVDTKTLKFINQILKKYNVTHSHITTCQTLQLHNLPIDSVINITKECIDFGIISRGSGGNFPRNVMCSPLSGVGLGERVDCFPYVYAVADYLLPQITSYHLPRKLKITFSSGTTNDTHATFHDLGFVARENGNFDVYSAGGLGNGPKLGLKVASDIEGDKILYFVQAMIEVFIKHGNYEVRAKARTRFMQDKLGIEGYIEEFQKVAKEVLSRGNLDIEKAKIEEKALKIVPLDEEIEDEILANDKFLIKQIQKGRYAYRLHPLAGDLTPAMIERIHALIGHNEDYILRFSPSQDCYIINLSAKDAIKVSEGLSEFNAKNAFECSISCVGASVCQIGLRDSKGMLKDLIAKLREEKVNTSILPTINISGCTSSCGAHQSAAIGLQGFRKVVDKVPQNAYVVMLYGCATEGKEALGQNHGVVLESKLKDMFKEIANDIIAKNQNFDSYALDNSDSLNAIVKKYADM